MITDLDLILDETKMYDIIDSDHLWEIIIAANESEKWELTTVVKESDYYVGVFKRKQTLNK